MCQWVFWIHLLYQLNRMMRKEVAAGDPSDKRVRVGVSDNGG